MQIASQHYSLKRSEEALQSAMDKIEPGIFDEAKTLSLKSELAHNESIKTPENFFQKHALPPEIRLNWAFTRTKKVMRFFNLYREHEPKSY